MTRLDDLRALAGRAEDLLLVVQAEYAWCHNAAYGRTVRGDPKVQSGAGDPTGDLATSRARMKGQLRYVERSIQRMVSDLERCEQRLGDALEALDPRDQPQVLLPKTVFTEDELLEAREAKRRREARGGGFGEG